MLMPCFLINLCPAIYYKTKGWRSVAIGLGGKRPPPAGQTGEDRKTYYSKSDKPTSRDHAPYHLEEGKHNKVRLSVLALRPA